MAKKTEVYSSDFYEERHKKTVYSAETILKITTAILPPVQSAVDIGCGVGTWLSVLNQQYGVSTIKGLDAIKGTSKNFSF